MTMIKGLIKTVYVHFSHAPVGTGVCVVLEGCRREQVAYCDSYMT